MGKQTKSNMPMDESKLSFQIPRTDQPREKILKLGQMITCLLYTSDAADD